MMNYDDAVREASRVKSYYPYRIFGVVSKDGVVWETLSGKTMSRFNSHLKKGYQVVLLKSVIPY